MQFRGRGDIPDSSEGGQKEILGRNLRNPLGADCIPGSGGEAGVFAVEVGRWGDTVEVEVGARLVTHFTKVCFKTVMWDSQQGGGGLVLH